MLYNLRNGRNQTKGTSEEDITIYWIWDDVNKDMKRFGLSKQDIVLGKMEKEN